MWYSTFSSKHIFLRVTDEITSLDENIYYEPHVYSVWPISLVALPVFYISLCTVFTLNIGTP